MNIKETLLIALAGLVFLTLTGVVKAEVVTDSNGNVLYEKELVDGHLKHVYKTIEIQNRVANRTCSEVDVPIYGNTGKAQTGEVLGGAIIGGILGNQVGGGKGKDAMTVLGAIIGADVANKRAVTGQRQIVGYRQEENCRKISFYETHERLENYRITYEFNGIQATSFTQNQYKVGDRIPVTISIQAN